MTRCLMCNVSQDMADFSPCDNCNAPLCWYCHDQGIECPACGEITNAIFERDARLNAETENDRTKE